jgi:hypothetical protein
MLKIQSLKWLSTILVLIGILLTNINEYPIKYIFSWFRGIRLDYLWLSIKR